MTMADTEPSKLEQAIEAERARLLQVHSVLHCLYEVLLYADGEDAASYAQAAHLAAMWIDDAVARLDPVRLRPMIEEIQRDARLASRYAPVERTGLKSGSDENGVKEPAPPSYYRH
jgi:hypothetical protein